MFFISAGKLTYNIIDPSQFRLVMLMPASNMRNCLELVLYIVSIPNARCAVPTVAESWIRGERSKGSVMAKAARLWKYWTSCRIWNCTRNEPEEKTTKFLTENAFEQYEISKEGLIKLIKDKRRKYKMQIEGIADCKLHIMLRIASFELQDFEIRSWFNKWPEMFQCSYHLLWFS